MTTRHTIRSLATIAFALSAASAHAAWIEVAAPTESAGSPGDRYGGSVAIDGDTLVVGVDRDDVGSNTDQGSVRVLKRAPASDWVEVATLVASDGAAGDFFGARVAVDGDTVVVGSFLNGPGAVYVFERDAGSPNAWAQVQKLAANDGQPGDQFGVALSIDGDTLVVGASEDDIGSNASQGSSYVFERTPGCGASWVEARKLTASDGGPNGDRFGTAVALSGDTIISGAYVHYVSGDSLGAVYLYERDSGGQGNWGEVKKLLSPAGQSGQYFGYSLSLDVDTAIIGAFNKNSARGAAYIFERDQGGPGEWEPVRTLDLAQGGDRFAFSVSISGDTAVAGAPNVDADGIDEGAVYVFSRDEGGLDNWGLVQQIVIATGETGDNFGYDVNASDDWFAVGAVAENDQGVVRVYLDDAVACGTEECLSHAPTCQKQIASSAKKFHARVFSLLSACRRGIQSGNVPPDASACDEDPTVASAIATASGALRRGIESRCTDSDLSLLSSCASSLEALVSSDGSVGCLVEGLQEGVLTQLQLVYGY